MKRETVEDCVKRETVEDCVKRETVLVGRLCEGRLC